MYTFYTAILLMNVGFLFTGFVTFVWYIPEMYEELSRKFILSLFIMTIGLINLIYLMSFGGVTQC